MLLALYSILILLLLLPLLAEIRMVIRSILSGSIGQKAAQQALKELSPFQRLTLHGLAPRLRSMHREYGQYLRMELFVVLAAVAAIALEGLFIHLRSALPALLVCLIFCVAAYAGIVVVHAHAGYDAQTRTTRYDRSQRK